MTKGSLRTSHPGTGGQWMPPEDNWRLAGWAILAPMRSLVDARSGAPFLCCQATEEEEEEEEAADDRGVLST